ncbi:UDP-N-acetylglucosamine 2-epimerase [Prochlorococcus marinus]|uniref:UDP-N-acetylglucosamine 2-epimerase n=1 Tax=Prochlorococcus marinus TaxID=1219 RepID=UPI001ADC0B68|nr:UDP-N-acetylglucosamine 2-epimerase [Prochlorococcus marinus]MBO8221426.1 UDP-N-acetylglucosamine 2-epimerase (hydrolyzing) [Prochlorococcus marinus CUG1417]MBW3074236.1 UDP-N-acetylglucosamine 2-epimerase (hydrolyzing) [Prochlorococcus marinus str. MU1417]
MKRKVCIAVHSRANYGRIKTVMREIDKHPLLELQLIVGSSALLTRFGSAINNIRADGFKELATVSSIIEGENPTTMAKSTGLAIIELATHFENLKPDIVLTVADRFETLATAIASSYMNIPLAHTQGGEVTGSIDESVRHAITKLAHIHFPATERAKDFILRLGEDPSSVYLTGCPAIDLVAESDLKLDPEIFKKYGGVGEEIDPDKDFIVVLQHPITTEYGEGFAQINHTLSAAFKHAQKGMQIIWLWPNVDAGSDDVSKGIRSFREKNNTINMRFYRNFSPEDYICLLANAKCIVGNSSSGLRECAFLGTPCVNIGSRQEGREKSDNVIDVNHDSNNIYEAINYQIKHGKYKKSTIVGDGKSGKKIANYLATCKTTIQKKIHYIKE